MRQTGAVRITLLHYSYPPIVGGVETIVAEHARLFAEDGHDVTVLCGNDAGAPGVRRLREIANRDTPAARMAAVLAPLLARAEVVFIHNAMTMPFHPGLTAALWGLASSLRTVRFVCWIHDLAACNPDYLPPSPARNSWGLLARAHDQIEYVAVSEHRAQQFKMLTGRTPRIIPNGVDPVRLLDLSAPVGRLVKERGILEREFILFHPTRLLRRKNVELGLRVIAELGARHRRAIYIITGAPDAQGARGASYSMELRDLRRELGLEEEVLFVEDLFAVTRPDLISLFRVADALFFPSRQEGFGLPILEAAVYRLPIFCCDLEPMNALIQHNVVTFAPETPAAHIATLIVNQLEGSPAIRARKEVVRRYSWEGIYREFLHPLLASAQTCAPL